MLKKTMPLSGGPLETRSIPSGDRLLGVKDVTKRNWLPSLYWLPAVTRFKGVAPSTGVACRGAALLDATTPW